MALAWIDLDLAVMKASFKRSIIYRFSALISLLTGPLYLLFSYIIWGAVFEASGQTVIAGFSFEQIVTYYVIMVLVNYFTWDMTDEMLKEGVRKGDFVKFVIKPVSFVRHAFMEKIGHRALALFMEILPVMAILFLLFGPTFFRTSTLLAFFATLLVAFIISFIIRLIIGMSAFWFVRPNGILWVYRFTSGVLSGMLIPLSFFPESIQKVLFVLPFQFIRFVPAQAFLGSYELAGLSISMTGLFLLGLLQVAVWGLIAYVLWRISIKKFCGVGT